MITFRTIILSALITDKVKELTTLIVGDNQADSMWNTPLSPTWVLPATHYISSWIINEEFALLLPLYENWEKVYNWQAEAISQASWAKKEDIETLFSLMYVSEEEAMISINRLNLKLCENIYDLEK